MKIHLALATISILFTASLAQAGFIDGVYRPRKGQYIESCSNRSSFSEKLKACTDGNSITFETRKTGEDTFEVIRVLADGKVSTTSGFFPKEGDETFAHKPNAKGEIVFTLIFPSEYEAGHKGIIKHTQQFSRRADGALVLTTHWLEIETRNNTLVNEEFVTFVYWKVPTWSEALGLN